MKVVKDRTRQRWSRRIRCGSCFSELEIDRNDVWYRHPNAYVECGACGKRVHLDWDSLPGKVCSHVLASRRRVSPYSY